ncbi:MAG: hypothetical protein HY854_20135 [Burkholderiales bacterium]|nr:hypothetical protein [Burkholderiales bacterium]
MLRGSKLSLDQWLPPLLLLVAAVGFGQFLAAPPLASPDAKLAAAVLQFESSQQSLARRLCTRPLPVGPLGFNQSGVPPGPMLHKALATVSVKMKVEAPAPDAVTLTLTTPELEADGVHWLLRREPVPAGTVLRSEGRCVAGKLYWAPLWTSLDKDRLRRAQWRAAL